ncbi:hypothetical protein NADFUDRAFT_50132 [Nadsonia fulvescens var. elongata DSM 6958]|uniref:Uncharacterized protein n=1 Tax=Nadsonia fulvescens var. elongata DSM 6958 TaxID=857566 RepID=A0A1E3PL91_9ASCO|nr:hypothetical protein NADFUDRAFT_50132 [Nadsonia fulvescens var. elongata DSM 6958]
MVSDTTSSGDDLSFKVVLNYRAGNTNNNKPLTDLSSQGELAFTDRDSLVNTTYDVNSNNMVPTTSSEISHPDLHSDIFKTDLHTLSLKQLTNLLDQVNQHLVKDFIKNGLLDLPMEEESKWKKNADLVANHLILLRFYWKLLQTKRKKAMKLKRLNKKLQST